MYGATLPGKIHKILYSVTPATSVAGSLQMGGISLLNFSSICSFHIFPAGSILCFRAMPLVVRLFPIQIPYKILPNSPFILLSSFCATHLFSNMSLTFCFIFSLSFLSLATGSLSSSHLCPIFGKVVINPTEIDYSYKTDRA